MEHRCCFRAGASADPGQTGGAGGAREAGGAIEGTLRPGAMMLAPSESYRDLLASFQASSWDSFRALGN
jgi:hypothetical protein